MVPESSKQLDVADRVLLLIMRFLRVALAGTVIFGLVTGEFGLGVIALGVLALTYVTDFIEQRYQIDIPLELEVYMSMFVFAAIFLGEIGSFYDRFWWWDVLLHSSSALVFGFVGFLILYVLYWQQKLQTSPLIIAVFSFSFAMAIGGLWEIFEFAMDELFGLNMQKSGLADTMGDLIVDGAGALVTATVGYRYIKREETGILGRVTRKFLRDNPRFARKLSHRSTER